MKTFKNLNQVYKAAGQQVTAQSLLNNKMYLKNKGWSTIKLTDELREEIAQRCADIFGGWTTTKRQVFNHLMSNQTPQHWGLEKVLLSKYGNKKARFSSCAGQDQQYESNIIRTALK